MLNRAGGRPRVLILDNYDSFTYNLAQYLGEMDASVEVVRNDRTTCDEVGRAGFDAVVVSPGPCTPGEAGISLELIRTLGDRLPILGVCLGHQAIGAAYGADVVRAEVVMHGKVSPITHDGTGVFEGIATPMIATRYHSLVVEPSSVPACLLVNATSDSGVVMGLRHRKHPVHGVQFHPESILTQDGRALLQNFLRLAVAA